MIKALALHRKYCDKLGDSPLLLILWVWATTMIFLPLDMELTSTPFITVLDVDGGV